MTKPATFLAQVAAAGDAVGATGLAAEARKMGEQVRLREVAEQAAADMQVFEDALIANPASAQLAHDYAVASASFDAAWAAYVRACGGRAA